MSTPFEPTQSELNDIKLHKMIIELGYYGNDLVRVAQAYQEMKDTSGEKSHKAYIECKEALDSVISNFLSGKPFISESLEENKGNTILKTLTESEILLEEEWGPADEALK